MRFIMLLALTLSSLVFGISTKNFSVMSYNAENLFDTVHDEGKNDYPYLPLELKKTKYKKEAEEACLFQGPVGSTGFFRCFNLDWNEKTLERKLLNLVKAISMYDNGKGADIVIMQEVENQNVMNLLLEKAKPLGYKATLLLEDQDSRGIDVAILSKYPIVSSKLHPGAANTGIKRGIYQFNLNIHNSRVAILGNHWPSQHNDVGDRMNASDLFVKVGKSIGQVDAVIALGDYNTPDTETPNAVHAVYNDFFDARPEAEKLGAKLFPGTYKYRGKWDVLDRVLIRKDITRSKVKPVYETFEVINNDLLLGRANLPPTQSGVRGGGFQGGRTGGNARTIQRPVFELLEDPTTGAPIRFNPANGQGFSDHLPVGMKFEVN
jgi:endonuclease/exonuclease/phosphatase family metal-dependent hydrolase